MNKILKSLFRIITDRNYRWLILANFGKYDNWTDERYIKRKFKAVMGAELDLENPKTFNEKLQWLKLYNRKPEYTVMADKYAVRQYIAEKLGEQYLIPLLGVWDDPEDIDFDALPEQFVLKCNHNSGLGMCICKDKSKLDIDKVKSELKKGLKQDYYLTAREWPYKDIPKKIIAEKFMIDNETQELRDYKFFCFGGECRCMKVDFDRFIEHHANYYNPQGNSIDLGETVCPPDPNKIVVLPKSKDKMIEYAERLSKDIPFLRVDFYDVNGDIYFGELTFYPASGFGAFTDTDWDCKLGEWIKLPESIGGGYLSTNNDFVFLLQKNKINNKNVNLTDYKFFCFNGEVDCVMVCIDRAIGDPKFYFFDKEWNLKRYNIRGKNAPEGFTIPKPSNMDEMFNIAKALSAGLPFSRIDLYSVSGKTYFGEITFFPDSGFDAKILQESDTRWGEMLNLPKKNI